MAGLEGRERHFWGRGLRCERPAAMLAQLQLRRATAAQPHLLDCDQEGFGAGGEGVAAAWGVRRARAQVALEAVHVEGGDCRRVCGHVGKALQAARDVEEALAPRPARAPHCVALHRGLAR